MARQTYPLEALRKLRDEKAEALAQGLGRQIARTQQAQAALAEREAQRRDHAARAHETVRAEQQRLQAGAVSGVDLRRVADFQAATRAQAEVLERAESAARQALAREQTAEQNLRVEQAAREAEAKLVRNHEQSFHERQAELAQKAEEEAALEQWNAIRH